MGVLKNAIICAINTWLFSNEKLKTFPGNNSVSFLVILQWVSNTICYLKSIINKTLYLTHSTNISCTLPVTVILSFDYATQLGKIYATLRNMYTNERNDFINT